MLLSRYFTYSTFENTLDQVLTAQPALNCKKNHLGFSVEGRSIYGLEIGQGTLTILAWSQMHGNESTTTRALIELLQTDCFINRQQKIKLYIIPVLNPDGLDRWTRVNANGIDLNRDAITQSQPESKILRKVFEDVQPDFCFNLHGQRTIYGNMEGSLPAQLSFLSPAGDAQKTVQNTRLRSMAVINAINSALSMDHAFVGRYGDDFNINCVGDYFTAQGAPTILFEAGHAGQDYCRHEVTQLMTVCITTAIDSILSSSTADLSKSTLHEYLSIPPIAHSYADILIKSFPDVSLGSKDIGIKYMEEVIKGTLYFIPVITSINDKTILNGHRVIDASRFLPDDIEFLVDEKGVVESTTFAIHIFCE